MNKLVKIFSFVVVFLVAAITLISCGGETQYKVTFNVDGKVQTIHTTGKITGVETPKKEGYRFLGWFIGDQKVDLKEIVKSDKDLVAKFEKIEGTDPTPDPGSDVTEEPETPGDKKQLEEEVKLVEAKIAEPDYSTKYDQKLREALEAKLEEAKELLNKPEATENELDNLKIELHLAYEDLLNNKPGEDDDVTPTPNPGEEPQPQPNLPRVAEEVEVTVVEKTENQFNAVISFGKGKGLSRVPKEKIEELKESYLPFLQLNEQAIPAERLTIDMAAGKFKIAITELKLNDKLLVKKGLIYKAVTNKETNVVEDIYKTNADVSLIYNGSYFVVNTGQSFDKIEAQNIEVDNKTVTVSSTTSATINVSFLPAESKGTITTSLNKEDSEVQVQVNEGVITISTTKVPEQEEQLELTITLQGKEVSKKVIINIVKDVNNSSISENNIVANLTYKEGGTGKYENGDAVFTDSKSNSDKTLSFVLGRKNKESFLDISGYSEKHKDSRGSITFNLESEESIKKITFGLKAYSADKKYYAGLTVELVKKDVEETITKEIATEDLRVDEFGQVTISLDEAVKIKSIKLIVKVNESLMKNKPRVGINQIIVYKLNS